MKLKFSEVTRVALSRDGKTVQWLAGEMGISRQYTSIKLNQNQFSNEEKHKIISLLHNQKGFYDMHLEDPVKYLSYKKLFVFMNEHNVTMKSLREYTGLSASTITKLKKGDIVTTDVIAIICEALDCQPGDIMELITD